MKARSPRLYAHGSIVIVSRLLDPQGRNPKDRRCVVVSPDATTAGPDDSIDVVAISSLVPSPVTPECVDLPWQLPFHPVTKLHQAQRGHLQLGRRDRKLAGDCPRGKVPTKVMLKIDRALLTIREGEGGDASQ